MKFFQKVASEVSSNTLINCMYTTFFKKEVYIKFSGIPVKSQTVWQNSYKYISLDQIYFYCIFMRSKVWQKYCLLMQKKNGFIEFHHFMKKERLNNSSKTFSNQWEPMGFRKLQRKKMWGNFHDETETMLTNINIALTLTFIFWKEPRI